MADTLETLRRELTTHYRVEHEVGRGGMASVYLAEDLRHHRQVALKVLKPELALAVGAERFLREIEIAANLTHPHILPLLDSGDAAGLLYYVMPYVEGESLGDRLHRERQLPVDDAVRITREVASALDYAHRKGTVHRDIKPGNILLQDGHALVTDFGVARALTTTGSGRITDTGISVGTPIYMSPEQASGDREIDGRSDIYSLGCVLYEMLAGEPPFTGPTVQVIIAKRFTQPVRAPGLDRPSVPRYLGDVLARALSVVPADRFATAHDFAAALGDTSSTTMPATAAAEITVPVVPRAGATSVSRRRAILLGAGILAASAVVVIAIQQSRETPATISRAAAPALRSVAVLPFANLTPNKEDEYFSDGMSEELIHALAKVSGLRVSGRTSSFAFKGREEDAEAVGRRLGVDAVLDGSVRRSGDRLRIGVQLVGTRDGYELWSETYEREARDVFAVQDEIAHSVVRALRVRLASASGVPIVARQTEDLEAYNLFLQGRALWNRRTSESLQRAVQLFDSAVIRDPSFARAHGAVAQSYALLGAYSFLLPGEMFPEAIAAAHRALELDSTLAEAHSALGLSKWLYEWDWTGAERELRRAIELNPSYATAHQWYALYLGTSGRAAGGVSRMRDALSLDPMSLIISADVGELLYFARRYDQALEQYRQTLQMDSTFAHTHSYLGKVYERMGRFEEAISEHRKAVALSGGSPFFVSSLGYAFALAGRRDEAMAIVRDFERDVPDRFVSPYLIAEVYLALGDQDRAFVHLERALAERMPEVPYSLLAEPRLDPLRSHPRFAQLVKRMGL
ncbi:MAG: protein kinase [Gemmatimonadaceae bacterium]